MPHTRGATATMTAPNSRAAAMAMTPSRQIQVIARMTHEANGAGRRASVAAQ